VREKYYKKKYKKIIIHSNSCNKEKEEIIKGKNLEEMQKKNKKNFNREKEKDF